MRAPSLFGPLVSVLPFVPALLLLLLLLGRTAAQGPDTLQPLAATCDAEEQVVQCGWLPVQTPAEVEAYTACCDLHRPMLLPPRAQAARAAAAEQAAALAAAVPRPDLDLTAAGRFATAPDFAWASTAVVNGKRASSCVAKAAVKVPAFSTPNKVTVRTVTAPLLSTAQIVSVKAAAQRQAGRAAAFVRRRSRVLRGRARGAVSASASASFIHPGGLAGPSELSLLLYRVTNSITPQAGAKQTLLSGAGVPPKYYRYNATIVWNPPVDCPASWQPGPYAMAQLSTKWGGGENDTAVCPANYPPYAPLSICGHVSAVEMDGQMAYKQALAYHATGDASYAANAFAIVNAWATTNKAWGMPSQNGPLEAAWSIASLARTLEVLRTLPDFAATSAAFMAWWSTYINPQIDTYVSNSANSAAGGNLNVYINWQSSMAEAWMAVAVLSDDAALYGKARALYQATVKNYLRWGFDSATRSTRTVGECTETMRDIYHTLFGLGGLLQAAEWAWVQNDDWYSYYTYALVAAMELHARIINAWDSGKDETMLPPRFKFYEKSMPAPPAGCEWALDVGRQTWYARNIVTKAWVSDLKDGVRYALGTKWLPTGWEVGYNHFSGRLGIRMPETAALLTRYPIEHHEFHWGEGTLTHADTAYQLWRPGLNATYLCV